MDKGESGQVAIAVAELRLMNSQVSCVSGRGDVPGKTGSPTLLAIRGGGFSVWG